MMSRRPPPRPTVNPMMQRTSQIDDDCGEPGVRYEQELFTTPRRSEDAQKRFNLLVGKILVAYRPKQIIISLVGIRL